MGREATRREMSPVDAGMEAFYIAQAVNGDLERCVREAIAAGVETAYRAWSQDIRDDVLAKAEALDDDDECDLQEDGVAALLWYGYTLDGALPPEQQLGGFNA